MSGKVTIEVDPRHEALVRQVLALSEEMEQLALTAPEGTVFAACEEAILPKGRRLQSQILAQAVARRIEAAEKKGRLCGPVAVDGAKKTKVRKNDIS
jgi:hypothetical protein